MRSSHGHFVKTSGLRWISLMLLAPIPWAGRVWALPFLTALVPSERCNTSKGRRHKTLLDFGRQLALQARRWLPDRDLVLVADSSVSSLLFPHALRRRGLTRLRLDAALHDPVPPRRPGTMGRPRKAGRRLATLAGVAATRRRPGGSCGSRTGMAEEHATSRSPRRPPHGAITACPWCRSGGC